MDTARLLTEVRRLREQHGAGSNGGMRFNIFETLRSSTDEVNLHSRFLHALLARREPDGSRKNLEDFLTKVAKVKGFPSDHASVGREVDGIDLLIESRDQKQAVLIENKIWAGDQDQQLQRYWKGLRSRGYPHGGIHLLYLTPFGDPPSVQSVGDLEYTRLSYRDDLPRWLERCGRRALNETALRESIVQYLDLIRTLTNSQPYMTDLKNLCLDGDNLILAQDLSQAMVEAKTDLIVPFWSTIDHQLQKVIGDPLERDPEWKVLTEHDAVRKYVERAHGSYMGLYYWIAEGAWLAVEANREDFWFGVSCNRGAYLERHDAIQKALSAVTGGQRDYRPWYCHPDGSPDFRNLDGESLSLLKSDEKRLRFARTISAQLQSLWDAASQAGLIQPRPG